MIEEEASESFHPIMIRVSFLPRTTILISHELSKKLCYINAHFSRSPSSFWTTARTASSKTFLRPFCVKAEHSTYLQAWVFFCLSQAFLICDRCTMMLLLGIVHGFVVISKIDLHSNDQNGHILVVLTHFRSPLRTDAVNCERSRKGKVKKRKERIDEMMKCNLFI